MITLFYQRSDGLLLQRHCSSRMPILSVTNVFRTEAQAPDKVASIIFVDKKIEHGKLPTLKEFKIGLTDAFRTTNNGQ